MGAGKASEDSHRMSSQKPLKWTYAHNFEAVEDDEVALVM